VSALGVVVGEVAGDLRSRGVAVIVLGQFEFGLDGSEAGFHEGVVVAVGGAAHALSAVGAAEDGSIVVAGVLPAAVAVMNETRRRLAQRDGLLQRVDDERVSHLRVDAPADNAP
jgi:hypothetical protein